MASKGVTGHNDELQPVWESLEGELDLEESWAGINNVSKGLEEEVPPLGRTGRGWDAEDSGSVALCQGAAFLANLVTAASAITVAIIALDR